MEMVVEIPDDMIKSLEQGNFGAKYNIYDLVGYLMNGTPLPKHHGRLIEVNELLEHELFTFTRYTGIDEAPCEDASMIIDNAQTIIEGSDSE